LHLKNPAGLLALPKKSVNPSALPPKGSDEPSLLPPGWEKWRTAEDVLAWVRANTKKPSS